MNIELEEREILNSTIQEVIKTLKTTNINLFRCEDFDNNLDYVKQELAKENYIISNIDFDKEQNATYYEISKR